MTINRQYLPDASALQRVVDILFRLLVESSASPEDAFEGPGISAQHATCLWAQAEG
jgi:hypothetical protein